MTATTTPAPFTITGVRVFDGHSTTEDRFLRVADGIVSALGSRPEIGPGHEVVDGTGCTVLPGLLDAHTHALPGRLEQAIRFGVTTELDMFNDPDTAAGLRALAAARPDVADIRSAGTGATAPGGHPIPYTVDVGLMPEFPTVRGEQDAAAFVAGRVAEGSDHLKIFVEPGRSTGVALPAPDGRAVRALAEHARDRGLLSAAHCTDRESARLAVRAGVDGLAHVVVDGIDEDLLGDLLDRRTFVIPTLVMLESRFGRSAAADLLDDPRTSGFLDGTSRATLAQGDRTGGDPAARAFDAVLGTVGALHRAGVPLLAGSDAINPGTAHGASLHRELELLVRAGLSATEALTAATATPAAHFGLADRGRLAPGMRADLLLVRGDPTREITATRDVVGVWRGGHRLDRTVGAAR